MFASTASKNAPYIDIPVGIALALSNAIIDTVRDPLLVLDEDQRITAASRSFYQTFKLAGQDLRGQVLFDIDGGQWNIPELRELLQTIAKDQETIEGYEVDREFPVIGRRTMLLNVRKVYYEKGTHSSVLLAFEDVTDRRGAVERPVEEMMREKGHAAGRSCSTVSPTVFRSSPASCSSKARTVQSEEIRTIGRCASARVLSVAPCKSICMIPVPASKSTFPPTFPRLCETLAQSMIGGSRPITLKVVADAGTVCFPMKR